MFNFLTKAAEGLHLTASQVPVQPPKVKAETVRHVEVQPKAKADRHDPDEKKEARRGLMIF